MPQTYAGTVLCHSAMPCPFAAYSVRNIYGIRCKHCTLNKLSDGRRQSVLRAIFKLCFVSYVNSVRILRQTAHGKCQKIGFF